MTAIYVMRYFQTNKTTYISTTAVNRRGLQAWAAGAVIYELITGEHPLPNYPNQYIGWKTVISTRRYTYNLPDLYPSAFQSIVCRLLHPSPDLRASVDQGRRVIASMPDMRADAEVLLDQNRTTIAGLTAMIGSLTARVHVVLDRYSGSRVAAPLQEREWYFRHIQTAEHHYLARSCQGTFY